MNKNLRLYAKDDHIEEINISDELKDFLKSNGVIKIEDISHLPLKSFKEHNNCLNIFNELMEFYDARNILHNFKTDGNLFISGQCGSGKTTYLIKCIEYFTENTNNKLIIFDPKMVEFNKYQNKENVISVISGNDDDAINEALSILETEYERRACKENNDLIVIFDEFGDYCHSTKLTNLINKIEKESNERGIYFIFSSQQFSSFSSVNHVLIL